MKEKKNKKIKKRRFKDVDEKIFNQLDSIKTNMAVEFNDRESASIKYFSLKNRNKIKVSTRFMRGKILIFAKLFHLSFIYDLSENF